MANKKRIGFLSYWGWGRGQAYLTLCHVKMLLPEYEVFILKQFNNPIAEEFNVDVKIMEVPTYNVDPSVFETWIEANKLDAVVFNEYNQWGDDGNNLVKLAKDLGCRTYGWLVWEKWSGADTYRDYDRIIASTVSFERFFRKNKFRKFTYIPYSIDLNEFQTQTGGKRDKFTFFHPGGWGGVHNRKNTDEVIEAFEQLNDENTRLVITSQKELQFGRELHPNIEIINKNLTRKELIALYYDCDAVVLPSKWESIGLPILEALAAGKPVITSNAAPMSEFIKEGMNGYLTRPEMKKFPDISIYAAIVDPTDLKNKMISVQNKLLYPVLTKNARYIVEKIYNLENNKKYFLDFLEKDLK